MTKRMMTLTAAALMSAAAFGAGSTSPHVALQIKSGLWEFTETPKLSGDTVFPDAMTKNVPAPQRAQFLADMRKQLATPSKVQECLTQAQFERQLLMTGTDCTQTVASNTAAKVEIQTACRGQNGDMRQEVMRHALATAATSTTTMHAVSARGGKTMTMDNAETGHWLSASCGDVQGIKQLP